MKNSLKIAIVFFLGLSLAACTDYSLHTGGEDDPIIKPPPPPPPCTGVCKIVVPGTTVGMYA